MRVLVTTYPGKGHFHPVAPLALALQRAGHDLRVATDPKFGQWVEACGLSALPAGCSEAEMVGATSALGAEERAIQLFTSVSVPAFATDVLGSVKSWRPDLVVSEEGEHAGPLVAAVLDVPSVTHSWPAPAQPHSVRAALAQCLEPVWRSFGQESPVSVFGDHYLDCCPPPWQTLEVESITGVMAVRPSPFDGPPIPPPPWLADVVAPVVFVTLGTVSLFARPDVLRFIAESVTSVAGTVVVATGPLPDTVVPSCSRVRVTQYVPLSAVLPVTDLVISHGGAGTSMACLVAGVPQVVIPQGAPSQRRVAAGIARSGVGAALDDEPLEAETITAAARQLLRDPETRQRIESARTAIDALPRPERVAGHLAELV